MKSELSIDVLRPREAVFPVVLENVADWSITCIEDEVIEMKNDGGVGTTFRIVTEEKGRKMEFTGEVTAYDPPNSSRAYMVNKSFDIDVIYDFEEIPGGTRVTQRTEVHPKGFTKVVFTLMGWMFKKSACDAQLNELEAMKAHAEAKIPVEA